jgi:2-phosphosulfolactate phosphatase
MSLGRGKIVRVCPSPALFSYYQAAEQVTVVVDVLRATSAIAAALFHGAKGVIPVASIEEAETFKGQDVLVAAERGGAIVPGFQYGNSPLSYINNPEIKGKALVLSTTNGTQAIEVAKAHGPLVTGAFSNISALTTFLHEQCPQDVLVLCAGWKNRINLEDTIFAGALAARLLQLGYGVDTDADATLTALYLFEKAQKDMDAFMANSSHRNRLQHLDLKADIAWCMQEDTCPVIPCLEEHILIPRFL